MTDTPQTLEEIAAEKFPCDCANERYGQSGHHLKCNARHRPAAIKAMQAAVDQIDQMLDGLSTSAYVRDVQEKIRAMKGQSDG